MLSFIDAAFPLSATINDLVYTGWLLVVDRTTILVVETKTMLDPISATYISPNKARYRHGIYYLQKWLVSLQSPRAD
jgi:hypothetical protein